MSVPETVAFGRPALERGARVGALLQRALRLHRAGNGPAARRACRRIIRVSPGEIDAYNLLAAVETAAGQDAVALTHYRRALEIAPGDARLHNNCAVVLRRLGRLEESLHRYDQALAIAPGYVAAHLNRGHVLQGLKRLDEAIESHQRATRLLPDDASAFFSLGNALREARRWSEALEAYARVIEIDHAHVDAYCNLGVTLQTMGLFEAALQTSERAIGCAPGNARAWHGKALAHKNLGQLPDAFEAFERALALQPDYAEALSNFGNLLRDMGRLDEARARLERSVELMPDGADLYNNLGFLYKDLLRLPEALACYERAIALNAGNPTYHWNKALVLLLSGHFEAGWTAYESRWNTADFVSERRSFSQPLWNGTEDIRGSTILLHAEQGLGDTIQFVRYVHRVAARGARVVLEVPRPLLRLCRSLAGVSQLVERGQALPAFDWHCPLLSLPRAFGTVLSSIPAVEPYPRLLAEDLERWGRCLRTGPPKVGIAWSGSLTHRKDAERSLALASLLQVVPADCQVVSLQREIRPRDRGVLEARPDIFHAGESLSDFQDTAALCSQVDLVISVDTSIAHLAGTLGKETWVLLPFSPDWRWLLDIEQTPWYPSLRLYRQRSIGDWSEVLARVAAELEHRFS